MQHRWLVACFEQLSQALGWGIPAERFAWASVELDGYRFQVLGRVHRQIGALGEVLAQQPVDASMSSSEFMLGDVVFPGSAIREHRPVDDVDQAALENPSGPACPLGGLVARKQRSRARMEALLHDGSGVEHAVQPPVAASV